MINQEIVRKRITAKVLTKLYPQVVADKIIEIANDYGNEGEMGIKSFIPQTVDTNHVWYTREGDKYIAMDVNGKEATVQMVSQDTVGASNVSNKLDSKFRLPAETYMITITYYKKHIMNVYTCEAAKKLGPANKDLVAKLEKSELLVDTNKVAIVEGVASSAKGIVKKILDSEEKSDLEGWDKIIRPYSDSEAKTEKVNPVESRDQLPDELINTGIEDIGNDPGMLNNYDPTKRDPVVLQPRKRRTKPLEVAPVAVISTSKLKMASSDGVNMYHGEVVITGVGDNEGKEVKATMKIGGRKWITLSGGWSNEIDTGNMKEIMGVFHTQFHRSDGSWKNNKAGNGWIISNDWLKKIISTK